MKPLFIHVFAALIAFTGLTRTALAQSSGPSQPPRAVAEVCYPPTTEHYPNLRPPITEEAALSGDGVDCATTTTEMREKFPNVVANINRLEGTWTDMMFRRTVRPLPKSKQYRDSTGALIVNEVDPTTVNFRFNANKKGIWVQEDSKNRAGKTLISSVIPTKICKKGNDIFLKIGNAIMPVAFPSNRCMWVGAGGQWHRFWKFQDINFGFPEATAERPRLEKALEPVEAPGTSVVTQPRVITGRQ